MLMTYCCLQVKLGWSWSPAGAGVERATLLLLYTILCVYVWYLNTVSALVLFSGVVTISHFCCLLCFLVLSPKMLFVLLLSSNLFN